MNVKVLFRKDLRELMVSRKVLILLGVFIFLPCQARCLLSLNPN